MESEKTALFGAACSRSILFVSKLICCFNEILQQTALTGAAVFSVASESSGYVGF